MGIYQRYVKKNKEGNFILDKNGKFIKQGPWFIQYPFARDPQTNKIKYRTEKASFNKKQAERMFRAKVDAFLEHEKLGNQVDTEMIFSEFMDWGLSQEVMKAKASASDDVRRAGKLKAHFGDCKAAKITPLEVENFRMIMKQTIFEGKSKPYSGTTINKMITLARRIYYLGIDAGIIKSNPFARRGTFKEEPIGQYIPDEEFWKIYEFLPEYLKSVSVTAYLTGMRRGEVIELEWNRVDFVGGFIDLSPGDTKTKEPRRIYFNSVKELKNVFVEARMSKNPNQRNVFAKPDGEPVPKWYIERLFKKACLKACVGPYRFHDLRHTFNTNMNKAGVSKVVTMKLTGHKTLAMFLRYSHLDKEEGEEAMRKLNSFLLNRNKRDVIDQANIK